MKNKSMLLTLGASLSLGLAGAAGANQFSAEKLGSGYANAKGSFKLACGETQCDGSCGAKTKKECTCGADKKGEAKCGAGKCGANMEKKSDAKCGANMEKKSDAKCGASMDKKSDAKCGAGKCGSTES